MASADLPAWFQVLAETGKVVSPLLAAWWVSERAFKTFRSQKGLERRIRWYEELVLAVTEVADALSNAEGAFGYAEDVGGRQAASTSTDARRRAQLRYYEAQERLGGLVLQRTVFAMPKSIDVIDAIVRAARIPFSDRAHEEEDEELRKSLASARSLYGTAEVVLGLHYRQLQGIEPYVPPTRALGRIFPK